MRVLVCGGREYGDVVHLGRVLDALNVERSFGLVIEGGATGADRLAREWATRQGIPVATYMANWEYYGKGAGPKRNQWMLTYGKPHLVVAFHGGRGTANMVEQARAAGVEVLER